VISLDKSYGEHAPQSVLSFIIKHRILVLCETEVYHLVGKERAKCAQVNEFLREELDVVLNNGDLSTCTNVSNETLRIYKINNVFLLTICLIKLIWIKEFSNDFVFYVDILQVVDRGI